MKIIIGSASGEVHVLGAFCSSGCFGIRTEVRINLCRGRNTFPNLRSILAPKLAGSVLIQKPLITSSPKRAKIGCANLISRERSSKDPLEDINPKDGTSFV